MPPQQLRQLEMLELEQTLEMTSPMNERQMILKRMWKLQQESTEATQ